MFQQDPLCYYATGHMFKGHCRRCVRFPTVCGLPLGCCTATCQKNTGSTGTSHTGRRPGIRLISRRDRLVVAQAHIHTRQRKQRPSLKLCRTSLTQHTHAGHMPNVGRSGASSFGTSSYRPGARNLPFHFSRLVSAFLASRRRGLCWAGRRAHHRAPPPCTYLHGGGSAPRQPDCRVGSAPPVATTKEECPGEPFSIPCHSPHPEGLP